MNNRRQYERTTGALVVIFSFGASGIVAALLGLLIRLLNLHGIPALS